MRFLYTFFIYKILLILQFARFFSNPIDQLLKGHRKEREKLYQLPIAKSDFTFWFHTASLGEFEQCRPLIEQSKRAYPKVKILLTFFSPSGYEVQKNYALADGVCYLPFDTPRNVAFFLNRFQPKIAVFVKYEFWPNYLYKLNQRKIPVFSVSSRFHKNQLFFKYYGKWMFKQLSYISHFFVQDNNSKNLLESHGFKNVTYSGDTRMDRVLEIQKNCSPIPEIETFLDGKPCVVIGSSWEADHALLFPSLLEQSDLKIIIAPHLVDTRAIDALIKHINIPFARWSKWNPTQEKDKKLLIVDTIGILSKLYQYADWSYVGGGMTKKGLHNILEPAAFEIPVIIGKYSSKFAEAQDLIALGGVFRVDNSNALMECVELMNSNEEKRDQVGKINKTYILDKSGATKQIFDGIFTELG